MTHPQLQPSNPSSIDALDSLPTLPVVAIRVGELVHARTTSVQQVADVLADDPALSAKLLRLVNSPYFGIPGGVSDIKRAIPFVGFNTLYQLVLSISVLETLASGPSSFEPRRLWAHSLTVGTAARVIAEQVGAADPDTCFTAGLLHDIGKIALAVLTPSKLAAAFDDVIRNGMSPADAEGKHGLPAHDAVGSRLARRWRFPANLVAPIEHHHQIDRPGVRDRLSANLRAITEAVTGADFLSQRCAKTTGIVDATEDGEAAAAQAFYDRVGLTAARLDELYSLTMRRLEASKVFLNVIDSTHG